MTTTYVDACKADGGLRRFTVQVRHSESATVYHVFDMSSDRPDDWDGILYSARAPRDGSGTDLLRIAMAVRDAFAEDAARRGEDSP